MGEAQARSTVLGVFRLQLLANGIGAAIVAYERAKGRAPGDVQEKPE